MQYNLLGTWQEVNTPGDPADKMNPMKIDRLHININVTQSFRLPRDFGLELSGYYQSSRLAGINLQKAYGSLDVGIKKKLPGTKGTFTFSAGNLLNTQDFILTTSSPEKNQGTYLHVNFVQRNFKLTYSRSFGSDKVKERRERSTGAEEEKGRVQ
jgi:hypothetical protein